MVQNRIYDLWLSVLPSQRFLLSPDSSGLLAERGIHLLELPLAKAFHAQLLTAPCIESHRFERDHHKEASEPRTR